MHRVRKLWVHDDLTGKPKRVEAMRWADYPMVWVEVTRNARWPRMLSMGRVWAIGTIFLTRREAVAAARETTGGQACGT